jgi:hypothetical protein
VPNLWEDILALVITEPDSPKAIIDLCSLENVLLLEPFSSSGPTANEALTDCEESQLETFHGVGQRGSQLVGGNYAVADENGAGRRSSRTGEAIKESPVLDCWSQLAFVPI